LVESLSLDEAYLDVSENLKGILTATEIAQEIKIRIKEKTTLTASAGVSVNKFLAKIASDYRKPDGLFVIKPLQAETFVETLEITKFHGIGKVTAEKMHKMGIFTGKDLRTKSVEFLINNFGIVGWYYFDIAREVDNRAVNPDSIRKSVGVENTFDRDLIEPDDLYLELDDIIEQLWRRMQRVNAFGKSITLKIKFTDFGCITRSRTTQIVVFEKDFLAKIAYEMLNNLLPMPKGVRLMGVSFSNLQFADELLGRQLTLSF
jgi:DNA polymerase-4